MRVLSFRISSPLLIFASALVCITHLSHSKALKNSAFINDAPKDAQPFNIGGHNKFPPILSSLDATLYKQVFSAQSHGNWELARSLISKISDPLLMGHILAQRYLHPTKYRSKYSELKQWMAHYRDHPSAPRIYKLALKRRPKNWKSPRRPVLNNLKKGTLKQIGSKKTTKIAKHRTRAKQRYVRAQKSKFSRALRRGHTLVAKRILQSKQLVSNLSNAEYDQLRARLGHAYFIDGRYDWAINWAGIAAKRSGKHVPEAHWTAGLAHWQLNDKKKAGVHFGTAANSHFRDKWLHAGAAFWASRAALVTGEAHKVKYFLKIAAKFPRTFYGIIANEILGNRNLFNWKMPQLNTETFGNIKNDPRGKRALALLQIGEVRRAERELRNFALRVKKDEISNILALVTAGRMAALALFLDQHLYSINSGPISAAYPIPFWSPKNGFKVDRAVIYALMHQESRFNPKAKSWAGARGLMQLMPGTASFVARDRRFRSSKKNLLFSPIFNMSLGQKYIQILLKDNNIKGDLFLMFAAWNGGPGNLKKWLRRNDYSKDPLFFIESIPSRETRNFVERVMSNLWIYRDQLGQKKPSLAATASGEFPIYKSLILTPTEVARTDVRKK